MYCAWIFSCQVYTFHGQNDDDDDDDNDDDDDDDGYIFVISFCGRQPGAPTPQRWGYSHPLSPKHKRS